MRFALFTTFIVLFASCTNEGDLSKRIQGQVRPQQNVIDAELAEKFVGLSLECVDKTYPYKPGIVLHSKKDLKEPRARHPVFYGCFDWHSAVHGHWALVKVLGEFPDIKLKPKIIKKLDKNFTRSNFEREAKFFAEPTTTTFERPYGMAWFLRLVTELDKSKDPQLKAWRENARPLEKVIVEKVIKYFATFRYPSRVGQHGNSAFAMDHMWDYALQVKDEKLKSAIETAAVEWFENDQSCPIRIEPSGGDFVSPCLAVAHLMAKVKPKKQFLKWFKKYFPPIKDKRNHHFFYPPITKDITDPKAGHLVGLTFQRAWSFKSIAASLPKNHPYKKVFSASQKLHLQSGVEQMFSTGYGGTHWLASFAIYAYFNESG